MSARRSQRPVAVLLAFLLALVVGEPLRMHDCDMHVGASRSTATTGESGGHHQTPDHAEHALIASGAEAPAHADHSCDCLGTCCTVASVRVSTLPVVPTVAVELVEPGLPPMLGFAVAPRPERLFPFPIGPPTPV